MKRFERRTGPALVVIGVGNSYRSDDAVGLVVAERVRNLAPAGIRVLTAEGEPAELMDAWKGAGKVVLIDAVVTGAVPGHVFRFEAHREPLPAELFRGSSHALGVADAIELARALGRLPPVVILYGVQGRSFAAGVGLSPEVEAAVRESAQRVVEEIAGDA